MKKTFIILVVSIFLFKCKNEINYENDAELCEILAVMLESDQRIRKLPEMANPFFKIMDSIRTANNLTTEDYAKLPGQEQLNWGKIGREIADKKPKTPKKIIDSLWVIQHKIDKKNTLLLIDIIRKRG